MDLLLFRLKQALAVGRRERATVRELLRLDGRELADIGLRRGDVPEVARRAAQTRRFDVYAYDRASTADGRTPIAGTGQSAGYLAGNALGWRAV